MENKMKIQRFEYILASFFLFALLLTACSSTSTSDPLPPSLSDAVSGKVDVGGYALYYICVGEGSPTVLLEAGGGRDSTEWLLVMLYFQRYTRICAYDRANLGQSDTAPGSRTYDDTTRELHALLQNAPIDGPYVLVGHSGGGMMVRLYASQYPDDVVGLVLVDSAHPDMGDRLLAALPPETPDEDESFDTWRKYATVLSSSDGRGPYAIESMDMRASNALVREVASLGDLPLAIVSRSPENSILMPGIPPLPERINTVLLQQWQDMQTELEGLSSNSTRFIANHSGHGIPEEEPRFVVDAIRYIVDEYRIQTGVDITPAPEVTDDSSHVPVLTGVTNRENWENGMLVLYQDISFMDPSGDAITLINKFEYVSAPKSISDDVLYATPVEQQEGAVYTRRLVTCRQEFEFVLRYQIFDAAGNVSAPEVLTFSCPAPKPYAKYIPIAEIALVLILVGLGILFLVRYLRRKRAVVA